MDLNLQGKRALVTGSSRGLGFAAARGLALEGARVAVNSRNAAHAQEAAQKLAQETHADILALSGDLNDPSTPAKLVQAATDAWGGLDILITNAGGPPSGLFEAFDDDAWQKAAEVSLFAHVRLIRAALPALRKSEAASVLTVTSYAVKQPIPNLILSNSVRAATAALTKSLAIELGPAGIRFNSILPGWTLTERVEELMASRARANGTSPEEEKRKQTAEIPLGRMASVAEFAGIVVFLASPAASYITGQMIAVDGGILKGTL